MNVPDRIFQNVVVEDDDVDRKAVRRILKRAGCIAVIDEAVDGAAALEMVAKSQYDCI